MRMDEVITFDTDAGRYQLTRRERIRLAILQGIPDAKARELGFRPRSIPGIGPEHGFSADYLTDHFDAQGNTIKLPNIKCRDLKTNRTYGPLSCGVPQYV